MAKDVRQDPEADYAGLTDGALGRKLLREVATGAITREWGWCDKCRSKVRTDVDDAPARVNAAKALLGKDETETFDPNLDPANLNPVQRAALRLTIEALLRAHGTAHVGLPAHAPLTGGA